MQRVFRYAWGNNPVRAKLKGRDCKIIATGSRMYSVLVEFDDGKRYVTSMRALKEKE